MSEAEVVCEIRYRLDPARTAEFEEYARAWMRLIERHGGRHLGCFMPREAPLDAAVSFPGVGVAGDPDQAVALYAFPTEAAYRRYRTAVARDPDAAAVIERFSRPPFRSYDRLFLRSLPRSSATMAQGNGHDG